VQASVAFERRGKGFRSVSVEPAGFMRLRGPHAGPEAYVRLDDWVASLDALVPQDVEALRALLQTTPRAAPAPDLPRGWFIRVALEDALAVSIAHCDDWRHQMVGVFDPDEPGLAVIEGRYGSPEPRRLLAFGGAGARERLRGHLTRATLTDVRRLEIAAVPVVQPGQPAPDQGRVLRRREFRFTVRFRT
jgi:hypothetical protein